MEAPTCTVTLLMHKGAQAISIHIAAHLLDEHEVHKGIHINHVPICVIAVVKRRLKRGHDLFEITLL